MMQTHIEILISNSESTSKTGPGYIYMLHADQVSLMHFGNIDRDSCSKGHSQISIIPCGL